jgi:hypothetical protein
MVRYVIGAIKKFQYWSMWISKCHKVTLHRIISVYDDAFDHVDGVMYDLDKKKTHWKEFLYFARKFASHKLF